MEMVTSQIYKDGVLVHTLTADSKDLIGLIDIFMEVHIPGFKRVIRRRKTLVAEKHGYTVKHLAA